MLHKAWYYASDIEMGGPTLGNIPTRMGNQPIVALATGVNAYGLRFKVIKALV